MAVIGSRISTNFFEWMPASKTFVAEASDLPSTFNPQNPIWDDAADRGFVLLSAKSDHQLIFTHTHNETDNEGDIDGFRFTAFSEVNPMLHEDMFLLIVND